MARRGLDRSAIVAALRVLLPLFALILLSSVFLLARPIDPTRALATAEIDVIVLARDPLVQGARLAGVTEDGTALALEALVARSDPAGALRFEVEGVVLALQARDGRTLRATAAHGVVDRSLGAYRLSGSLVIEAEALGTFAVEAAIGTLDRTSLTLIGPIVGELSSGKIWAGSAELTQDPTRPKSLRIVFRDGVRMLYPPPG